MTFVSQSRSVTISSCRGSLGPASLFVNLTLEQLSDFSQNVIQFSNIISNNFQFIFLYKSGQYHEYNGYSISNEDIILMH